jgi:DNA polymerase-1
MTTVYERLERPLVPGAGADGRARHLRRPADPVAPVRRARAEGAAARGRDLRARRRALQSSARPSSSATSCSARWACPAAKKTKTGQWSTGARCWRRLAAAGHELPRKIVDWRQLTKLKSTYTDALPGYVNPRPSACTRPTLAATHDRPAVLVEPNLQNIPVRTEEGRKIRTAFVADPGNKLISADYSQIELRVLAHVADIPQLKAGLRRRHRHPRDDGVRNVRRAGRRHAVEVRRRAKAINFGIIYGISAFGLANQLGIEREEAGDYIKKYFERFPGIKDYMDAHQGQVRPREGLCRDDLRPPHPLSGDQVVQPVGARLQRARLDQRADPGLGRRHHPPRHDPHGAGAGAAGLARACCCRCMTN